MIFRVRASCTKSLKWRSMPLLWRLICQVQQSSGLIPAASYMEPIEPDAPADSQTIDRDLRRSCLRYLVTSLGPDQPTSRFFPTTRHDASLSRVPVTLERNSDRSRARAIMERLLYTQRNLLREYRSNVQRPCVAGAITLARSRHSLERPRRDLHDAPSSDLEIASRHLCRHTHRHTLVIFE